MDTPGRPDEAFTLYNNCLELDPDYYEARYALGYLCLRTGRLPEAVRQLELAVERRPRAIEARLAWAEALAKSHQAAGAEKQLREVLRLDPDNAKAQLRLTDVGARSAGQ